MKEFTHAEQDRRDEAYMADLAKAPRFTSDVQSLPLVAAIFRHVHMTHFPHMRDVYKQCGFSLRKLHFYDDAEIRYVYTRNSEFGVWEIIGILWSCDGSIAPRNEAEKDFGPLMDEEALSERLREDFIEEEGYDPLAAECE